VTTIVPRRKNGVHGRDNVFVERLWRSVKYEEVSLYAYETVSEVRAGLIRYFTFFNQRRPRSTLRQCTPDAVYYNNQSPRALLSLRGLPVNPAA
jgi:transposase InsO family protein